MKKPKGWISRIRKLERAGKVEEAKALFEAHTTAAERKQWAAALRKLRRITSNLDLEQLEDIMSRLRALENPETPAHVKRAWSTVWDMTPRESATLYRYLPSPLAKPGGRPARPFVESGARLQKQRAAAAGLSERQYRRRKKVRT